jgi:flagellar capping protein FliD
VRGQDRLQIRASDPLNEVIRTFNIQPSDLLDQQYSLNNGLSFTLGAGSLVNRDTTAIQVFDNIGSVVIPGNAFNGVRNASANLQYGLPAIVDGAFQINGTSIAVNASDTLDAVIDRISQSSTGVTANFNSLTESIDFTQNTLGVAPTITIENDSSNFVEVSKLTGTVVVPGIDADPTLPLADVAEFAGVLSGDILLNSTPVSVDPATDSLEDVIDRINASGAGVVASFDSQSRRVTLTATPDQNELEIDSNGTGLLGALNLPEGKVDPEAEDGGISIRRRNRINKAFGRVVSGLNEFYSDRGLLSGEDADIQRLRGQLEAAIAGVFGAGSENFDSGIGLRFNRDSGAKLVGNFAQLDRRKLAVFLEKRDRVVRRFFNGDARSAGLTAALSGALDQAMVSLNSKIGTKGTLFDAFG